MRKHLIINTFRCTGCRRCELICSAIKEGVFKPAKSRIKIASNSRTGISVPKVCLQCKKPWCQEVCAPGAIIRDQLTGALVIDKEKCHGCRQCTVSCPYGNIEFDDESGLAIKCDLCNGEPRCVKACYPKAIEFKSVNENIILKNAVYLEKIVKRGFE